VRACRENVGVEYDVPSASQLLDDALEWRAWVQAEQDGEIGDRGVGAPREVERCCSATVLPVARLLGRPPQGAVAVVLEARVRSIRLVI
jgi:hypothetical protein